MEAARHICTPPSRPRGRRGNYSECELEEWARRLAQWRRRADVLVYFNNDWEGFAVDNARSLRRRFRNE